MKQCATALWLVFLAGACKPSLRDPNWRPQVSERMQKFYEALRFEGYKGVTPYKLEFPDWFIGRQSLTITELALEKVELGRFLFYDRALSADSTVACASCHKQQYNFADNVRFSPGVKGRTVRRNTMPLINLILDKRFFWDGRAASLEEQALEPIQNPNEMDLPISELIDRLEKHPIYPALFERAFGERKITSERIANALAEFVRSIISYSMPEDYFRAIQDGRLKLSDLPADYKKIWPLFLETNKNSNCGSCHQNAYLYGQNQFENVMPENKEDPGFLVVTKKESDHGRFKVLALRNVALTGPYMHDGSVSDLRSALTHYRAGRFVSDTQPDAYRDEYGNPKTDKLSQQTLDLYVKAYQLNIDRRVLTDARYSDPH